MPWHELIPREARANVETRRRFREDSRSPKVQKAMLQACKEDILLWINLFVFQYNPNAIGLASEEVGPFLTWDFQEEAVKKILECIETRQDLLIQKSREMGASWLCLLVMDWLFLFHPRQKFLMISRDELTVDKPGDSDSLFWKLDFVHNHLPRWMTDNRVKRRKLAFENPLLSSYITGQASTGRAGVGGRATAMFIDEFSQIKEDREVYQRTSDTTGCRIFNGTHRGPGTCFHELAVSDLIRIEKLWMHWTQHPDKRKGLYRYEVKSNRIIQLDKTYAYDPDYAYVTTKEPTGGPCPGLRSPWYDKQCRRKGNSRGIAMDLDIDVHSSVTLYFEVTMIQDLVEYCFDPWVGDIKFDSETGRPISLDKNDNGRLKYWGHFMPDGSVPLGDYAFGCDLGAGTGATPSCITGINRKTGQKVLEYANAHLYPEAMAPLATALCWMFRSEHDPAMLVWEIPGPGINFGGAVLALGFRRVYFRTDEAPHTLDIKVSDRPGWAANPKSTEELLGDYRTALKLRQFANPSKQALEECLQFMFTPTGFVEHAEIASKGDPSGARLNHGDRVIADALAWKLAKGAQKMARKKEAEAIPLLSLAWRRSLVDDRDSEQAW